MSYNFKNVKAIATAADMINIVLSKTQRKTPTVVHPGYAISRIRSFYMRKVHSFSFRLNSAKKPSMKDLPIFSKISLKLRTFILSMVTSLMYCTIRIIINWL